MESELESELEDEDEHVKKTMMKEEHDVHDDEEEEEDDDDTTHAIVVVFVERGRDRDSRGNENEQDEVYHRRRRCISRHEKRKQKCTSPRRRSTRSRIPNQTGPDGSLLAEKPNATKKNEKKKTNKPCHRRTNQIGR